MSFKNKVMVVTGGGNGIGREVVLKLLKEGAKVVALDISEENLLNTKKLANEMSNDFSYFVIDITKKEQIEELPQKILNKYSKIDGVLNIAGIIQPFVKVNELNYASIEKVMQVNFYGTLYMIKTFLPYLLNNKETSYISNVSSMGGFLPVPGQSVYGASKAAVKLLTEALYAELKNSNVKVSIVFPGAIATNIAKNSGIEIHADGKNNKFKQLSAVKAAEQILKGIQKEKFRILVGKDAKIMDFLYRLNPKRAVLLILSKMKSLLK